MKRIKLLGIVILIIVLISACSSKTNSPSVGANTTSTSQVKPTEASGYKDVVKVQEPKELKLDKDLYKKLNIFFTNFSEVELPYFSKDKLSNKDKILFGIKHTIINNDKVVENSSYQDEETSGKIAAKYIDAVVEKYFGKKISKHETVLGYDVFGVGRQKGYCTYKDGYYILPTVYGYQGNPMLSVERFYFSQIEKLFDNGDGTYTAYVNEYSHGDVGYEDIYSTPPSEWQNKYKGYELPKLEEKTKAMIKKETDGRYILIDYLEDK